MRFSSVLQSTGILAITIVLTACSKGPSVDGTYVLTGGPAISWPAVTVTFANGKYVISRGASGSYTVSDGKLLMTGDFSDVMQMSGDKLVGTKATFVRTRGTPVTWAKDCSGIADADDKAACVELKKGLDAEEARRQADNERRKHAQVW